MSGGGIGNQSHEEDRQVVILTFSGALERRDVAAWNRAIEGFKRQFGESLSGVTIVGAPKGPKRRRRRG